MFDKIDYKTVRLAGREVRLTINHSERSISARLNDSYPTELRLTGYLSKHLALGASVRLEYGSDEDMLAGLYLGPLRLYAGINNRMLGSILGAVKLGRRTTSIEIDLANRYEPDGGVAVKLRGHLWDDDNRCSAESRSFSVDLLDAVLGKPVTSEKVIVEERDAVAPLPEGSFTTKARLVERFVQRPGWPFKHFSRWVELRETPAVVPQKGGGTSFYNMGGPWTGVTGNSIDDGVAEFVRRVLEQRSRYGGKAWAAGVPAATKTRDSHEVSVWQIADGKEHEIWRGDLGHEQTKRIGEVAPDGPIAIAYGGAFPDVGPALVLKRDPRHGGPVLSCGLVLLPGRVVRGGDPISRVGDIPLVAQDEIHVRGKRYKVYGSPIGPAPLLNPVAQPKAVAAEEIEEAGARAGVHVNAGPAIGRTGRLPLRGLTFTAIVTAREADPAWFAANPGIVDGAGPGRIFDGKAWVDVVRDGDYSAHSIEQMSQFSYPQGLPGFRSNDPLDVATRLDGPYVHVPAEASPSVNEMTERLRQNAINREVLETMAELDTTPPGPTEEADGLSARERALAGARRPRFGVDLAAGGSDQTVAQDYEIRDGHLILLGAPRVIAEAAVSAMSAVLGNGEADLPPAPVDTRPWLPTGPLTVVITRGETTTTVRLPRATSYRVGAHKDAEIRLLGAHMLGALIEQDNGGVWVRRRSDNVAVDLLGLEPGEAVQLREGAEVQIGQLYTLTITSRSA